MNTSRKGNQLESFATHVAGNYYAYLFTLKLFPNNGKKANDRRMKKKPTEKINDMMRELTIQ